MEHLHKMVDAGRYVPTGFNSQRIRFAIIASPAKVAEAFASTGWLTGQPPAGQRPVAYIVVLGDGHQAVACATYAVMLAAHALGYDSCWHGCTGNAKVKQVLGLNDDIQDGVLISLGKPDEKFVVNDQAGPNELKERKEAAGTVYLGKLARTHAIIVTV
jgi:nitroreductase